MTYVEVARKRRRKRVTSVQQGVDDDLLVTVVAKIHRIVGDGDVERAGHLKQLELREPWGF